MLRWGLVDPVRIGSAIWYQMGPLMKVIPYEPYRSSSNRSHVNREDPYHSRSDPNGSEYIQSRVNVAVNVYLNLHFDFLLLNKVLPINAYGSLT